MEKKRFLFRMIFFVIFCLAGSSTFAHGFEKSYTITITNLTRGQIFSPPIVISHTRDFQLFELGQEAGSELAALAEDGDTGQLINLIGQSPGLSYAVSQGPVLPGESAVIEVTAERRASLLSIAGMLVTTNDGFFAVQDLAVPSRSGITVEADAYDAGSELNSEDCAFIPGPPCGNVGVHDPSAAEGYVHIHAGIHGIGPDPEMVDPAMHDWRNPVALITVYPSK